MDQDVNMPNKVTPSTWEQARKQQEDDQRRCSKDALADARPNYIEAGQNDIKRKYAKKATPSDNDDDEAALINHGQAAASTWVKTWKTVLHSFTPEVDKRGNPTITAEGGLPLSVGGPALALADGDADEDERPSLGYKINEDKNIIKYEGHSPDTQPESDTKSPTMDEMDVDERIASLNDAVATLAKETDPDSQKILQNILDFAHSVKKTNKLNPAASSSRPSTKAAPPAVAKAENKIAGQTEIEEKNRVDLEESDESEHDNA
jgi:hypothetical protein